MHSITYSKTMKSSPSNGSRPQARTRIQLPNPFSSNTRKPISSASRPCCDQPVVSLAVYKAQRRRAVLATQAAARRRTMIAVVLAVLGLLAGVAVHHRDAQMQTTYSAGQ